MDDKEDSYLDHDNDVVLRDGTRISASQISLPSEIEDRIRSLRGSVGRRQEEIEKAHRDRGEEVRDLHTTAGILRELWDEIREDLRVCWSAEWRRRRRLGIERRLEEVKDRLAEPPDLPDWLRLIPDGVLTPKQHEAMVLREGYGLSLEEAAQAAGIKKPTMRGRVALARKKVQRYWGIVDDDPGEGQDLIIQTALRMAYKLRRWDELWEWIEVDRQNPREIGDALSEWGPDEGTRDT